jgi:hypothetical protein
MSDEPLDRRILREIRARLSESRAAAQEYERLQAALGALEPTPATTSRTPSRARRRTTTTSRKPRARRGANRDQALQVIADRPGVTVAELASATGIARNVLYSLTRTLTQRGAIERVELPADTVGFRIARSADSAGERADGGGTAEPVSTVSATGASQTQGADDGQADTTVELEPAQTPTRSEPAPA